MTVSLPLRERGLKSTKQANIFMHLRVAPLAGAWIEIRNAVRELEEIIVAPLAGAWIEIY